jgi:hypothetical protein
MAQTDIHVLTHDDLVFAERWDLNKIHGSGASLLAPASNSMKAQDLLGKTLQTSASICDTVSFNRIASAKPPSLMGSVYNNLKVMALCRLRSD